MGEEGGEVEWGRKVGRERRERGGRERKLGKKEGKLMIDLLFPSG